MAKTLSEDEQISFVNQIAGVFAAKGMRPPLLDDLRQELWFGLQDSMQRFDPKHGTSFNTYAYKRTWGWGQDFLRRIGGRERNGQKERVRFYNFTDIEAHFEDDGQVEEMYAVKPEETKPDFSGEREVFYAAVDYSHNSGNKRISPVAFGRLNGLSLKEIADLMALSESRVCQIWNIFLGVFQSNRFWERRGRKAMSVNISEFNFGQYLSTLKPSERMQALSSVIGNERDRLHGLLKENEIEREKIAAQLKLLGEAVPKQGIKTLDDVAKPTDQLPQPNIKKISKIKACADFLSANKNKNFTAAEIASELSFIQKETETTTSFKCAIYQALQCEAKKNNALEVIKNGREVSFRWNNSTDNLDKDG